MSVSVQTHTTTNYKFISNRCWAHKLKVQYKFSPITYVLSDLMQKIFYSRNVLVRQFKDGDLAMAALVPFAYSLNLLVHSAGTIAGRYKRQMMEWEHYVLVAVSERPACCGVKSHHQGWLQSLYHSDVHFSRVSVSGDVGYGPSSVWGELSWHLSLHMMYLK